MGILGDFKAILADIEHFDSIYYCTCTRGIEGSGAYTAIRI